MEQDDTKVESSGDSGREAAPPRRAGQDHRFLDLEISKVLLEQASRAAHEALRQLLVERVKAQLEERLGGRLDVLAEVAVDDLVADFEANLDIERRIEARAERKEAQLERMRRLFSDEEGPSGAAER